MYEQKLNYHIQLAVYEYEKLQELQASFQDPRSHGPNNFILKCLKEKIQLPKNERFTLPLSGMARAPMLSRDRPSSDHWAILTSQLSDLRSVL